MYNAMNSDEINFALGTDRHGKPTIQMYCGPEASEVALVSPACVTNWPRVTGDGNFGTMWGPTDIQKAKFTLDLTDAVINDAANELVSAANSQLGKDKSACASSYPSIGFCWQIVQD